MPAGSAITPAHSGPTTNSGDGRAADNSTVRDRLRAAIDHAAEFLPAQGPITVFVAQNTLEPLEDVPFDEGVLQGAKCYHAEPYLLESRYREEYEKGRIRVEDLAAVLEDDLGPGGLTPVAKFGSRFDIRLMMLRFPLRQATGHELRWFLVKTDALLRFRDEAPFSARRRMIAETRRWIQRLSVEQLGGWPAASSGKWRV
ncbi:MAG: putative inorganic carbon transporter subunit DabA [Planctomycetaceae bacterium]